MLADFYIPRLANDMEIIFCRNFHISIFHLFSKKLLNWKFQKCYKIRKRRQQLGSKLIPRNTKLNFGKNFYNLSFCRNSWVTLIRLNIEKKVKKILKFLRNRLL